MDHSQVELSRLESEPT